MYSYITKELPSLITAAFPIDGERCSIFGHSMGGHGALTLFLRNPTLYRSVSAFAPISNPLNCPWGQKAFSGYFGTEASTKGAEHDASELLRKWSGDKAVDILVDVVSRAGIRQMGLTSSIRVRGTTSTSRVSFYPKR